MIRKARPTDAAAVAEIWNHYIWNTTVTFLPDEKSVQDIEALLVGPDPMFVAVQNERITGFARYFQFRGGRGYLHTVEHTVLLAPDAAGQGLGRALMAVIEDDARSAQKHSLWAGVSAENAAGVAFHAAIGFDRVAVLPEVGFKFGRWIDLVLMQKRL